MRVGHYRTPAAYQEPTDTTDDLGQEIPAVWSDVWTLYCEVRTPYGRENVQAQQLTAVVTHAVEHRFPSRLPLPRGRYVLPDGVTLWIVSTGDPDGLRRRVVSLCTSKPYPDGDD